MSEALINIFSDGSNEYLDFTKILGAIAFVVFLALSGYEYIYRNNVWDPTTWATACGILLGSVGGVSKIKDYTATGVNNDKKDT